ncbi:MAG: hypothetical protein ABMB14_20690 [Myxococcota bacterium]
MTGNRRFLRASFHSTQAPRLAAAIGLNTPWTPASRTSDFFAYFADSDRLAVVAGPHEQPVDVDKALAYGLSYSGDRDLLLLLPAGACWPTLARVAFTDVPIRVFEHDEAGVRPLVVPSRRAVLDGMRTGLVTAVHELAARALWVAGLVAWADAHPELNGAHRQSYLSWHCRGRQVLRVQKVGGGLQVVGGVQESGSRNRLGTAVVLAVGGAIADADLVALRAAVDDAVEARLRGVDRLPDEHWLQAVLGADPERLGLSRVRRERPAFRPGHPESRPT